MGSSQGETRTRVSRLDAAHWWPRWVCVAFDHDDHDEIVGIHVAGSRTISVKVDLRAYERASKCHDLVRLSLLSY
jgi:hypothetical protein